MATGSHMHVFLITFGNDELLLCHSATPDHNNSILEQRRDRKRAELESL